MSDTSLFAGLSTTGRITDSLRGDVAYPEDLTFIGKLLIEWWSISCEKVNSGNWFSDRICCRVAINTQSPIARSLRLLFPAILLAIMVNIPKYFETRTAVVSKLHGASLSTSRKLNLKWELFSSQCYMTKMKRHLGRQKCSMTLRETEKYRLDKYWLQTK